MWTVPTVGAAWHMASRDAPADMPHGNFFCRSSAKPPDLLQVGQNMVLCRKREYHCCLSCCMWAGHRCITRAWQAAQSTPTRIHALRHTFESRGSMYALRTHPHQLMLREYRRQVPLCCLHGKCPGRLPRCALKAADGTLPSYASYVPCPAPERMP